MRDRFGGPAPRALSQAIACYNQEISDIRSRMQEAARQTDAAGEDLQFRFNALLGAR